MSRQIDERVVEMRFDNKHFEKNVKESITTLDKFKKSFKFDTSDFEKKVQNTVTSVDRLSSSLKLKNGYKGIEHVGEVTKKTESNILSMGKAVEQVGIKFNALYTVADQALRNITTSVMGAGKKIVNSLTIEPIFTGFKEYETQINAVQTILANTESKGSTLQDVNNALAQLNTYADKTIYNFTEMTRNIGTFTAAGVDLKTSVSAIKGIANLAAVSGSNSQQASTAMYQLSQALASGTVKLMDWNSVVNAGMGGQVFQDSLKETARIHGVAIDDMIKKEGSFRETLQEGWLTSEILTETLSKFTGDLNEQQLKSMGYTDEQIKGIIKMGKTANDAATKVKTFTQLFDTLKEAAQSGWTKSWELLIGDFGEAKELLTDISNLIGGIIGGSADKRNAMLMGGLSTGWKQLLNEGIHDAAGFEEMVTSVAKSHGVDIASMINDETSFQDALKQTLKDGTLTSDTLGESISKFTEKVGKMSEAELENAGYTAEQIEKLKELDAKVKDGTISMEKFAELIVRPSGRELLIESLWNVLNGLKSILSPIKQAFDEIFPSLSGEQLYGLIEKLKELTSKFKLSEEQAGKLKSTFKGLFSVIDIVVTVVKEVASGAVKLLGSLLGLGDGVLSITGSFGDWLSSLRDVIKESGVIGTVIGGVTSVLQKFINTITKKFVTPGIDGFLALMQKLWDVVVNIGEKIIGAMSDIVSGISNAFRSGGIKAVLDTINTGLFGAILLGIRKFMKSATDAIDNLGGIKGAFKGIKGVLNGVKDCLEAWQQKLKSDVLFKLAGAIGILAVAILLLASIEPAKLAAALGAITVAFADLIGAMKLFDMIGGTFKGVTKATIGMIGMSVAVLILASALKKISDLNWKELAVGLTGITVLMSVLVKVAKVMSNEDGTIVKGAGQLILFAAAIKILASAVKDISGMKWEDLGKGLAGVIVLMGAFVGAMKLFNKIGNTEGLLSTATSMILLGVAVKIFASAVKDISGMKWEELERGLLGMASALLTVTLALRYMPADTLSIGAGLILVSTALVILAEALSRIGGMSWEELEKGLYTLGGAILTFAVALNSMKGTLSGSAALLVATVSLAILTPILMTLGSMKWGSIVKGLVALAGAFVIIGVAGYVLGPIAPAILALAGAIALIGVGCLAAGVGLIAAAAGITALATAVAAGTTAIVAGIAAIVLGLVSLAGDIIVGLCTAIVNSASALYSAIKTLLTIIIDVVVECVPMISEALAQLFVKGLELLATYAPQIVEGLYQFLINVFDTVAANAPRLAESLANMFKAIFQSVIDAFGSEDMMSLLVEGLKSFGVLAAMMLALNGIAILTPGAMAGVLGLVAVLAEIGAISQIPGLTWLIGEGAGLMKNIGNVIGNFVGGIVGGLAEGVMSALPQIASDLSLFMTNLQPFIVGAAGLDPSMLEGVQALSGVILALTASNILDGLTKWFTGGTSLVDFGKQIAEFGPYIKQFSDSVAGISPEAVTAAANAGKMLAGMAESLPNSGGVAGWFAGENDMEAFGAQLKGFGKGLADFSTAVDGKVNTAAVESAANAGVILADMAKSMPNGGGLLGDIVGNNDMDVVGPQLVSFGKALADFSAAVSGKLTGFEAAVGGIKKLTSMLADIGKINVSSISSLKTALKELGTVSVDGFINSFKGASESASTTVSNFITSVKTAITNGRGPITQAFSNVGKAAIINGFVKAFSGATKNAKTAVTTFINSIKTLAVNSQTSVYQAFYRVGSYAVDGFAAGISMNMWKSTAKARLMASQAETAAKTELDQNSPSRVFMDIGSGVVEGFVKGISDNLGDVDKSATVLGSTMLTATQDYLKINSPSIVFKDEVGRYIVQGIAEGIEADMSAEEAAKKKADNIVSAFKKEIDKHDLDIDTANKEFDLWSATDGLNAHPIVSDAKQIELFNKQLLSTTNKSRLAHDEWKETCEHMGKDSEEAQTALNKYLDTQIEIADIKNRINAVAENAVARDTDERELIMEVREAEIERWKKISEGNISDEKFDSTMLGHWERQYKSQEELVNKAEIAYLNAKKTYGENSVEALNAYKALIDEDAKLADIRTEISEIHEKASEREIEALEREASIRDKQHELWEKTYGETVSDAANDARQIEHLNEELEEQNENLVRAQREYSEAVRKFGSESRQAREAYEVVLDEQIKIAETKNAIADIQEAAIEREKELLEKQYDLAASNADLKYQIWENVYGRDATNAEKDTNKLTSLNDQLIAQTGILKMAQEAYQEAVKTYGSDSVEALDAYNQYLQEENRLTSIHSNILDVKESIEDREKRLQERQRNAKADYLDYMEKYEKYYLEHGMTLEELERDAMLVSGYDPTKAVSTTISDTAKALKEAKNTNTYAQLLTGFGELGTSYVTSVSEGVTTSTPEVITSTTTMVSDCIESMKSAQPSWVESGTVLMDGFIEGLKSKYPIVMSEVSSIIKTCVQVITSTRRDWLNAGVHVVNGFIKGISSRIDEAAQAAAELARAALAAAEEVLDINSPSKVFAKIGEYAAMGLSKGLSDNEYLAANAATNMGERAINNLRNTIKRISEVVNSDIDTQPTIRPVLDLSGVASGTARLNAMVSRAQAISISSSMARGRSEEIQNGADGNTASGNTYQFTQNNYSPKALSRVEIYRQTKNQFSAMKRMVEST